MLDRIGEGAETPLRTGFFASMKTIEKNKNTTRSIQLRFANPSGDITEITLTPEDSARVRKQAKARGIPVLAHCQRLIERGLVIMNADQQRPLELDPLIVGKMRACLAAIGSDETDAEFVNSLLADMLTPMAGYFEGLMSEDEPRRKAINAKLKAIYAA